MSQGPPIRDAATVVVLREGRAGAGPEVCLLRRHARSGFAADAWVFPGGTLDAADGVIDPARWRGVDPDALAARFGDPSERVLAAHVAAARETFEEAGLLLARHADGSAVDLTDPELQALRTGLADRETATDFNGWLADTGLVLDLDALTYWSRWITPACEPKRFDTRFFLARAPDGQIAAHDRVETTGQRWMTPQDALDAHAAGQLHVIYPTVKNLEEMVGRASVDDLVADADARPEVPRVLPHVEETDDGLRVLHPDHPEYPYERYAAELAR